MRALVKEHREPGIWLQDVPIPDPGPNDVLVRVKKTAICGTDIHIYNWDDWAKRTIPVPMVTGHEFAGEIAAVGSAVTDLAVGDRVSGEGHLVCMRCRNCLAGKRHLCRATVGVGVNRQGCFAEYLSIPAYNAFRLPDEIEDDIGAILDPFGNATHATLSFDLVGEDVLITGAGPIGCMSVAIARHVGARNIIITDINDYRLDLARKMGATRVVNPEREKLEDVMAELKIVEGFDVGLEMSGSAAAFRSLLKVMNNGGSVSLLGIPPNDTAIDWDQVIFKGLVLKGIYGREMFETWYKMKTMLQGRLDISSVITHRFPVADFQEAFDIMRSGHSGKIVLDWTA